MIHPDLKGVKYLSYNFLFQSFHAMDMILNSLQTRQQVLKAFPVDILENFKPIVDILVALQNWQLRFVEFPIL